MKTISFYDAKPYDKVFFDNLKDKYDVECYEFYSDELRISSSTEFS